MRALVVSRWVFTSQSNLVVRISDCPFMLEINCSCHYLSLLLRYIAAELLWRITSSMTDISRASDANQVHRSLNSSEPMLHAISTPCAVPSWPTVRSPRSQLSRIGTPARHQHTKSDAQSSKLGQTNISDINKFRNSVT